MNWTPVTKKLPELVDWYLVTDWAACVLLCCYIPGDQKFYREIRSKRGQVDLEQVIAAAWMPLPEPYSAN
jgi:hypothetical protein